MAAAHPTIKMLLDAPLQSQGGPDRARGPPGRVASVRGGLARLRPRQLPHQLQEPGGSGGLSGRPAAHAAGPRSLPRRHHAHVKGEPKFCGPDWQFVKIGIGRNARCLQRRCISEASRSVSARDVEVRS